MQGGAKKMLKDTMLILDVEKYFWIFGDFSDISLRSYLIRKFLILAMVTLVYFFPAHFFTLLYVLAQVSLVIVAFASLRSMPSGPYCTVSWSSFIPHIE
jgi:hypothetical protein